jgi:hypothetical protein
MGRYRPPVYQPRPDNSADLRIACRPNDTESRKFPSRIAPVWTSLLQPTFLHLDAEAVARADGPPLASLRAGVTPVVITHDDRYVDEFHPPSADDEGRFLEQRLVGAR